MGLLRFNSLANGIEQASYLKSDQFKYGKINNFFKYYHLHPNFY